MSLNDAITPKTSVRFPATQVEKAETKTLFELPEAKIAHKREQCAWLGDAVDTPARTPNGQGWYQDFQNGSIYWAPGIGPWEVHGAILTKWTSLGREQSHLGFPLTDETVTPDGRFRFNHFQGGSIFWSPNTGACEIHGIIRERYDALGGLGSWLGCPTADEADFPEGGRVSTFEHGAIYLWPDTGAIELNDVVVHSTGIYCFGETQWDQSSSEDEPYVLFGVVLPTNSYSLRSRIYENVNTHQGVPDLIEIYRGKPYGITISVILMEHDFGDPNKYKDKLQEAVKSVADQLEVKAGVVAATATIPIVGPFVALAVYAFWDDIQGLLVEGINDALDTGDDKLGEALIYISPKQMVLLATRTGNTSFGNIGYKLETPLLTNGDASYKVYFGIVTA